MKWSPALVVEVPPGVVTVMSTVPAAPAGEVTVMVVGETTVTPVPGLAPNLTVAPVTKPVPVTVTEVPPAVGPAFGATEATAEVAS